MRTLLFCSILFLLFGQQDVFGQCDFITPPAVKKIDFAKRQITFSNVTMNGKKTTYLEVAKGETIKISTNVESRKNGDYCPNCIVQIYWGVRGHTSVCAKSFHGYQFNRKQSSLKFDAPMKDGIYYVTMGSTLDYSCKNTKYRPNCSSDFAFATIKVGNPDPEKKVTLTRVAKGASDFLKTSLIKSGCFGELDKIEWFKDDEKLELDDREEIPLTAYGTYKVLWSNCLASVSRSISYTSQGTETVNGTIEDKRVISVPLSKVVKPTQTTISNPPLTRVISPRENTNDIASLVANRDKFVLKNLIFDLGKFAIKQEAKEDLDKLATIMKDQPSMKILLEGHTDRRGSAKKNQILSEKRVESAKNYLVMKGVKKSSIETKGWGQQKPLIITKNVEEGKINRRVEIQILSR